MKKKAIKLATSTAIAASAFVAAAPVNKADAAVNVEALVKDAENASGALKWAISVEGTADGKTTPTGLYNLTKNANKAAQAAVAKTSGSQKVLYTARLQAVELQISRAMAYIDGITAGKKIEADTASLNAAIAAKDLTKVEAAYHKMTKEYRKQAALLDRVYGQSTRDLIRNATKKPAEVAIETVKVDVTVKMHLDAAAAAIKASDYKKAGESYAKAMDWMDKASATFKAQLTKSGEDVLAALPLQPVSVSRINDTTITVNFNKEVDALSIAHFSFDNGLTATDAKLSADKKVATITTTAQTANKTYTLYYKGVQTKLSFIKTVGGDNSSVLDNDATGYVKVDGSRLFTATFKNTDGSPYRGAVQLKTSNADVKINAINGLNITPIDDTSAIPNADGKITVRISAATTADAKVTFVRQDTKKEVVTGTTYFVAESLAISNKEVEVKYVNKEGKYFIADNGGTKFWFTYDSNDAYYDNGTPLTQEAFGNTLANGNKIVVTYNNNPNNGVSDFNVIFKKTLSDLDITTPGSTTTKASPFRIAANQQFTLVGKGQAGYTVYLYRAVDVTAADPLDYQLHGSATVDGSGTWRLPNINLIQDELAGYKVIQLPAGVQPTQVVNTGGENVWLKGGAFKASVAATNGIVGNDNGVLDVGEKVTFTTNSGDTIKLGSPLSVKLLDGDGTVATYTDGVNGTKIDKVDDTTFTVTFGAASTQPVGGNGIMSGNFVITEYKGITNQHGLGLAGGTTVTGL